MFLSTFLTVLAAGAGVAVLVVMAIVPLLLDWRLPPPVTVGHAVVGRH